MKNEPASQSIPQPRLPRFPEAAAVTLASLESHRDFHFRRTPERRIKGEADALAFINSVGFCTAFTPGLGLPCLREAIAGEREPVLPEHIQHDYAIVATWRLKDSLPAQRRVYYGKALAGRPAFVSREFLPVFLRLRAPAISYLSLYRRGRLSVCAKLVMDTLSKHGPAETRMLKLATGYSGAGKRPRFDRAMRELQELFLALKVEERYDPFTYVWDSMANHWAEAFVRAHGLSTGAAAYALVRRHFEVAGYGRPSAVARLLGINPAMAARAVKRLEKEGIVAPDREIEGLSGRWVVLRMTTPKQ